MKSCYSRYSKRRCTIPGGRASRRAKPQAGSDGASPSQNHQRRSCGSGRSSQSEPVWRGVLAAGPATTDKVRILSDSSASICCGKLAVTRDITAPTHLQSPVQKEGIVRPSIRFSIAALMGLVLVAAIGLAALRNGSETWAGVMLILTCGVLALAVVGVFCGAPSDRSWWLGFAIFGWGYLALAFWSLNHSGSPRLPTLVWLATLDKKLGLTPHGAEFGSGMGGMMGGGMRSVDTYALQPVFGAVEFGGFAGNASGLGGGMSYAQIGHCLWALLVATVGGIMARLLFPILVGPAETRRADSDASDRSRWKRWSRPAVVGVVGLALLGSLLAAKSRSTPGLWAGGTFLVTWGLLGFLALGAVLDRTKRGDIWLGATLFGAGYMILAFGRDPIPSPMPYLPTDQFLSALRGWLPRSAEGFFVPSKGAAAANARVLKALEQPVPMHFLEETTLEDVLKHVAEATRGPDGKNIPIYVDPIGLQEAEKSMTSTLKNLDLDGIPLKITLKMLLKQLDLAYSVRDGILVITSEEGASPVYEDPFLIGGHCLLALFAAALGGALAPLVSTSRREPG
jgi:hypothetical protein